MSNIKFATAFRHAVNRLRATGSGLIDQQVYETLSDIDPRDLRVVPAEVLDGIRQLILDSEALHKWNGKRLSMSYVGAVAVWVEDCDKLESGPRGFSMFRGVLWVFVLTCSAMALASLFPH